MKSEMLEFVLESSGVIPDIPHLHMVAPKGQTVLNPAVPWYDRHVAEIAKRFPRSSYSRYPELTRGNAFRYWAISRAYQSGNLYRVATAAPIVAGFVAAAVSGAVVGEELGKRSKPAGVDMYSEDIARYEHSAFGSSRMI